MDLEIYCQNEEVTVTSLVGGASKTIFYYGELGFKKYCRSIKIVDLLLYDLKQFFVGNWTIQLLIFFQPG